MRLCENKARLAFWERARRGTVHLGPKREFVSLLLRREKKNCVASLLGMERERWKAMGPTSIHNCHASSALFYSAVCRIHTTLFSPWTPIRHATRADVQGYPKKDIICKDIRPHFGSLRLLAVSPGGAHTDRGKRKGGRVCGENFMRVRVRFFFFFFSRLFVRRGPSLPVLLYSVSS